MIDNNITVLKVFSRLISLHYSIQTTSYLETMHHFKINDLCIILNINRNRYNYLKRTNQLDITLLEYRKRVLESELIK